MHISLPKLAEGSEHAVFLDGENAQVLKTTLRGIYGDLYYLVEGRIHQRSCTPLEYFVRLSLWRDIVGFAPEPLGITASGQIVTRQAFIDGTFGSQAAVDTSLRESGWQPVRPECFLWKRDYPDYEVWLGDTRDENFVETPLGIVPIDVRMWLVPKHSAS